MHSIDKVVINELTDHLAVAHRYHDAGTIFDTCEVIDPESPVTCTYSLAVGGLHDLHIPLWAIGTSVNLLCPQFKPLDIKLNTMTPLREFAFAFGPTKDINRFKNPRILRVCKGPLRRWHDEKLSNLSLC